MPNLAVWIGPSALRLLEKLQKPFLVHITHTTFVSTIGRHNI
jgi:hypothetical protein